MTDVDYDKVNEIVEEITEEVMSYYSFSEEEVRFYGYYVIKDTDYENELTMDENCIEVMVGYAGVCPENEMNAILNDMSVSVFQRDLAFESYSIDQTGDLKQILFSDVGLRQVEIMSL